MENILFCWLGTADIDAAKAGREPSSGPIGRALTGQAFSRLVLLSNWPQESTKLFTGWLSGFYRGEIELHQYELDSPMNYGAIYLAADGVVKKVRKSMSAAALTFHTSPGTPAMAAIWVLMAKTRYPARLIQTSEQQGLTEVEFPFELAAEFAPKRSVEDYEVLDRLINSTQIGQLEFSKIIHKCQEMRGAIALAKRFASRDVPVLIQGESGTGKELFARAIHQSSARANNAFIAVNCGAIPNELIDAELFGYEKGAFTGAINARAGYFEMADRGTLFLDEIADLPLSSQVRLLRVLQEREINRLGAARATAVDVRVIAATHKDIYALSLSDKFRHDLYYRLAVAELQLPPLRSRPGDIIEIIKYLMSDINDDALRGSTSYTSKTLQPAAISQLLNHNWPGNIRELRNVLVRASIWAEGDEIGKEDIRRSLKTNQSMNATLAECQNSTLQEEIKAIATRRILAALEESEGKISVAARKLGLKSHQVLKNWLTKYDITYQHLR